ncbi:MAG: D-aminoacylase [Acidimicrobiales bacterium]
MDYDIVIRGGQIADGLGGPAVAGDVAIRDDRIVAVGEVPEDAGGQEIAAAGKTVTPGFVDVHTHDDRLLLADPLMRCKTSQGVTTVVTGNCGISLAPLTISGAPPPPLDLIAESGDEVFASFGDYLDRLDAEPAALNAVCQVGHSTLRVGAMDSLDREATPKELRAMQAELEIAMAAGAAGFSTGLYYQPAKAATTVEVIALARIAGEHGGFHSTHMRDEGDRVVDSLHETFRIGKEADVPVVISHHKTSGMSNHGRTVETLPLIDAAASEQSLTFDVYPYNAASTVLMPEMIADSKRVIVTWSQARPDLAGRDLSEIADELGCDPVAAVEQLLPAGAIYFTIDEADVQRVLAHSGAMIGSDGLPHDTHPHPRLWGTFPRVLGHYARDLGLMSFEEAIRRMTSLPAQRFGLVDRGVIRPGAFADIVVLDAERVIDKATFADPIAPAEGIDTVMVNGRVIVAEGQSTGERPGRALRLCELGSMRVR